MIREIYYFFHCTYTTFWLEHSIKYLLCIYRLWKVGFCQNYFKHKYLCVTFFFLTNVSLFSTFFQTQQQTLTNFFHYLESKLYVYTFASCVVCLYCLVFCLLLSLFVCLFACLFGCHVIIASVASIFSFMYLHFLCSSGLAFSAIIVLFVFLEIDVSPNNLVLFI